MLQTQNLRFSVFFKKEALVLGKGEKGLCWVGWRIQLNLTRMELSAHGSDQGRSQNFRLRELKCKNKKINIF